MPHHHVKQGECLSQIAHRFGFSDYRTLYDHPENAELKRKRPNPSVIFPGDRVFIPERGAKEVEISTDAIHRVELQIPKRRLKIRVLDVQGEPLRDAPYALDLGYETREARTDGDGVMDETVPLKLEHAVLSIEGVKWALRIGHLDPLNDVGEEISGVQARLKNLGYDPGPIDGRLGKRTRAAIRAFQAARKHEVDGTCSRALLDELERAHGC